MIKLVSSAALALSVAFALSAGPVHANDNRVQFGLGHYSAHGAGAKAAFKHKFGKHVQRRSKFDRRAGTRYISQRRGNGHFNHPRLRHAFGGFGSFSVKR